MDLGTLKQLVLLFHEVWPRSGQAFNPGEGRADVPAFLDEPSAGQNQT